MGAPFIERLRGNRTLSSALGAITAAVVGVILNLAVWFALHTLFAQQRPIRSAGLHFDAPVLASIDPAAALLAFAAMLATFLFRVGTLPLLAGCALAGLGLRLFI
jgi:chromate transporter